VDCQLWSRFDSQLSLLGGSNRHVAGLLEAVAACPPADRHATTLDGTTVVNGSYSSMVSSQSYFALPLAGRLVAMGVTDRAAVRLAEAQSDRGRSEQWCRSARLGQESDATVGGGDRHPVADPSTPVDGPGSQIDNRFDRRRRARPPDGELVWWRIEQLEASVEGGLAVPPSHELEQCAHDRPIERGVELVVGVAVAVDLASLSGRREEVHVVASCEQPDVVDLWDPRQQ
jgi:hypothetical protein